MNYIITPYVLISAFAAVVAVVVAMVAWRRRTSPGGSPLVALMASIAIWSAGAALEYASVGIPLKVTWAQIQYIGVVTCPVFFLLLALEYTGQDRWLTRPRLALLFVVPMITLVLTLTNPLHGLIWPTITPIGAPSGNLALYTHGIGFYLGSVGYSYLLMLIGTFVLIRAAFYFPKAYRQQAGLLVAGALAPWTVNLIYIADLSPINGLELTPLFMALTGVLFAWSIFGFQLLDLAPVAREALIETMADGMVVLDAHNRIVDINPAARHLFGLTAQVQLGQPAGIVFAALPDWEAHLANQQTSRIELPLRDPTQRYLELTISPVYDRRQKSSGRLVIIHDITERKAAITKIEHLNNELEARVAERTQALLASEASFRQVIGSISDHVFAIRLRADGTETAIYRSPRMAELTGIPETKLQGDMVHVIEQLVHPDDHLRAMNTIRHMQVGDAKEFEYRVRRADGESIWVRTNLRIQPSGQDRIVFGVTSDITERKRMEETMVEIRALAELDKLRTELIGNVSHELRTPLGLIKAASTTLLRNDVSFAPEIQQRILHGIVDETDRLEHLVSNLLDISRLDQQRFFLQRELVDLNALVPAVCTAIEQQPAGNPAAIHQFVLHQPGGPVEAMIDARKIEQVLQNLLQNAVRYSPAGGCITVTLSADAATCDLRVTDEGIGISAEDQLHIFERFYRARDTRVQHIRGAGLGLAICYEIVQAHGGTLEVASALNHGSTFTVCLPRQPAAP